MLRCNGCSADDDYDDFGHFIFKDDFENFRQRSFSKGLVRTEGEQAADQVSVDIINL